MTGEEGEPPKVMESLLLSMGHYWSGRDTNDRQVDLLERHFRQDEMLAALKELAEKAGLPAPKQRQGGNNRTATKAQAEDVVAMLKKLGDEDRLPRFLVQSDNLPRVLPLLGAGSVGDERGVSARLEALESTQRKNMDEMKRMVRDMVRVQQESPGLAPRVTVSPAPVPEIVVSTASNYAGVVRGRREAPARASVPGGPSAQPGEVSQKTSFFDRQGGRGAGGESGSGGQNDRSGSRKRRREGEGEHEWKQVVHKTKQRQKPKAAAGTAKLAEFEDFAGPAMFWIGNTHPKTSKENVEQALKKCAEDKGIKNFKVDDAFCLTKDSEPRTKTWKVTVPGRLKDLMEDSAMYPAGWSHRTFSFRPERPRHAGAPAGPPPANRGGETAPGVTLSGGAGEGETRGAGAGATPAATGTTRPDGAEGTLSADTVVTLAAGSGATPAAHP